MILLLFVILLSVGCTKVHTYHDWRTCEAKMREAMRSMLEYINEAHIPGPESPFRREFLEARKHWQKTMKECVQ